MPISPINWFQAPIQNTVPDIMGSAKQGFLAGLLPKQMQQAMQAEELMNRLRGYQGETARMNMEARPSELQHEAWQRGFEREVKPEEFEHQRFLRGLEREYEPEKREIEKNLSRQKLFAIELENKLLRQYGEEQKRAEIEALKKQTEYAYASHLTPQERNAAAIIGMQNLRSPEGQRMVAALNGVAPDEVDQMSGAKKVDLPEGTTSMAHWPDGARNEEIKSQRAELNKIQNIKVLDHAIDDAISIMDSHPNMWKEFQTILSDPDNETNIFRTLSKIKDEDQATAVQEFSKITSQIINRQAEALGGRGTVFRTKLLQREKPSLYNTPQANKYILTNLKEEFAPQLAREKPLLNAFGKYALPISYEYERKENPHLASSKNKITDEDIRHTAQIHKMTEDEVRRELKKRGEL